MFTAEAAVQWAFIHVVVVRLAYELRYRGLMGGMAAGGKLKESSLSSVAVFVTAVSAFVSTFMFVGPSHFWALTSWDEAAIEAWQAAQAWAAEATVIAPPPPAVKWAGAAVVEAGALMLWATHHHLGAAWAPFVSVKKEQKLVTSGPYSLCRHPMYTSVLLFGLGSALATGSWLVGGAWVSMVAALCVARVPQEEAVVRRAFGQQYQRYAASVPWKVVPYVW